jgi:hypothetical protein
MGYLRSIQITLYNNSPYEIQEFRENLCHGDWGTVTPNVSNPIAGSVLPPTIGPDQMVQWESHQHDTLGVSFSGTEGWVKYSIQWINPGFTATNPNAPQYYSDLLWIYWDNPYIWSGSTNPIQGRTNNADIPSPNSYCDNGDPWPGGGAGSGFATAMPGPTTVTEVFMVSGPGDAADQYAINFGNTPAEVWDWVVAWPLILSLGFIDAESYIDLQFTLGLRQKGSVEQSIRHFYDGSKGLRALAVSANQPSLRKLFAF